MPLASFRVALLLSLGLLSAAAAPRTLGQQVEDSFYGPLPVFEFHSGFWVNLHHFLYHEARARAAAKDSREAATRPASPALRQSPGSQPSLTLAEQRVWEQALTYYLSSYTGKDLLVNIDLILLKNQLGDFEDCNELTGRKKPACDAGLPGNVGIILEAAAPIYRAHWWADHDRANRRWVTRVAPLVREQGVGLSERLADIYQSKWPKEKIRVEVCAFANSAGAYTTLDPLRVTIASTDPRNQGPEALEVLFHEASHDIARPVEAAITRECRQRDKPIPRDLWHALIFFTTGEVLRPIMLEAEQQNTPDNDVPPQRHTTATVPPGLREKLSQRGWEEYSRLLSVYWQPYLDGKVTFEDAIAHLVSAV
ncbi:MAG: hypothetical protein ABSE19_03605 [Candidatus Acidiferrum sp.]|jgi:hypothetical protein